PDLLELVRMELEHVGYAVSTAANVTEALALLAEQDFDVVVSDIRMPGASGIELLERVQGRSPDTEGIITTAYAPIATPARWLRAGAFDFLQKPFAMLDLTLTIARALERRELRAGQALGRVTELIFETKGTLSLPERIVQAAREVMGADDVSLLLADDEGRL